MSLSGGLRPPRLCDGARHGPTKITDYHLEIAYQLIAQAVRTKDMCPTNAEIAGACQRSSTSSGARIMLLLVKAGRVEIVRRSSWQRQVNLPGVGMTKSFKAASREYHRKKEPPKKHVVPLKKKSRAPNVQLYQRLTAKIDEVGEAIGTQAWSGCKYIYGCPVTEPHGWRFCSRPTVDVYRSWCDGHFKLVNRTAGESK